MRAGLPEHMVPSAFVTLERLPLTPSGKLNRRALPAPDPASYATRQYEAPQGELEQGLARIWQELLQIDRIGRQDNFFDLGGHSLLAMRMVARAHSCLAVEIPVRLLFDAPTIQQLSAHLIEQRQAQLFEAIEDGDPEMEQLLDKVFSMSDGQARELLAHLHGGGRV
jgi:acyl carrier protein